MASAFGLLPLPSCIVLGWTPYVTFWSLCWSLWLMLLAFCLYPPVWSWAGPPLCPFDPYVDLYGPLGLVFSGSGFPKHGNSVCWLPLVVYQAPKAKNRALLVFRRFSHWFLNRKLENSSSTAKAKEQIKENIKHPYCLQAPRAVRFMPQARYTSFKE